MKKTVVLLAILLIILAVAISFLTANLTTKEFETKGVLETHSHTKAICDETNYCQDYVISCHEDVVLKMNPITGAAIQLDSDWQDPRNEQTRNSFC